MSVYLREIKTKGFNVRDEGCGSLEGEVRIETEPGIGGNGNPSMVKL